MVEHPTPMPIVKFILICKAMIRCVDMGTHVVTFHPFIRKERYPLKTGLTMGIGIGCPIICLCHANAM